MQEIICSVFSLTQFHTSYLTREEKKRNRMISLVIALVFILLYIALYYTHQLVSPWCIMLYCGQMMAVVLLTIGKTAEAFSRQHL